jgi:hypothetical protein
VSAAAAMLLLALVQTPALISARLHCTDPNRIFALKNGDASFLFQCVANMICMQPEEPNKIMLSHGESF